MNVIAYIWGYDPTTGDNILLGAIYKANKANDQFLIEYFEDDKSITFSGVTIESALLEFKEHHGNGQFNIEYINSRPCP